MKYTRHITVPMNKKRNLYWSDNFEHNKLFIKSNLWYVEQVYRAQGYIYLSEIFKLLNRIWNPDTRNYCWIVESGDKLKIYADYSNVEGNEIVVHIEVSNGMEEEP